MANKYLLAFLFHPQSPKVDKIVQFKRRYDPKIGTFPGLHAGLLPPFILASGQRERDLILALEEDVESFYSGHQHLALDVARLDIKAHKGNLLMLQLQAPEEVVHFQEMLLQNFPLSIEAWPKGAHNLEMFITLGRFPSVTQLHQSLVQTGLEFDFPFPLKVEQISLLRRMPTEWQLVAPLHRFVGPQGFSPLTN